MKPSMFANKEKSNQKHNMFNPYADNRARTMQNKKEFKEDPNKAVFLKGFRTDLPNKKEAVEYRERCYQQINRMYRVYIVKFDLPVNKPDAFLHLKSVKDARSLLNLSPGEGSNGDPCMMIEGQPISVKVYKKTRKRINEEKNSRPCSAFNSRASTRPTSPVRTQSRFNNTCNSGSPRINRNPLSLRDSALASRNHTDQEDNDDCNEKSHVRDSETRGEESQDNQIDIQRETINIESEEMSQMQVPNDQTRILGDHNAQQQALALVPTSQPEPQAPTAPLSFESVTNAVESRLQSYNYADDLLRQNWVPAFNNWPDNYQLELMVRFFLAFKLEGPEAAVQIIEDIKIGAQMIIDSQIEALKLQLQVAGQMSQQLNFE
jgi:hypothetical protein